jgi:hypothetical protein
MSLEDLFESIHDYIADPAAVSHLLSPFVERARVKDPDSTVLQQIEEFVAAGMIDCTRAQLFSIAHMLNGEQLFMVDNVPGIRRVARESDNNTPTSPAESIVDTDSLQDPQDHRDDVQGDLWEQLPVEKTVSHVSGVTLSTDYTDSDSDSAFIRELESFAM